MMTESAVVATHDVCLRYANVTVQFELVNTKNVMGNMSLHL